MSHGASRQGGLGWAVGWWRAWAGAEPCLLGRFSLGGLGWALLGRVAGWAGL